MQSLHPRSRLPKTHQKLLKTYQNPPKAPKMQSLHPRSGLPKTFKNLPKLTKTHQKHPGCKVCRSLAGGAKRKREKEREEERPRQASRRPTNWSNISTAANSLDFRVAGRQVPKPRCLSPAANSLDFRIHGRQAPKPRCLSSAANTPSYYSSRRKNTSTLSATRIYIYIYIYMCGRIDACLYVICTSGRPAFNCLVFALGGVVHHLVQIIQDRPPRK